MDHLMYLFTAAVLIAAALAGIAVRAPLKVGSKVSALVLAVLLIGTAYASMIALLGKPKSTTLEWVMRNAEEARVLSASIQEDKAIYLWLQMKGNPEPLSYVLPWSQKHALELQQAMRQSKAQGTAVRMTRPFDVDPHHTKKVFYAAPQQEPPPKTVSR